MASSGKKGKKSKGKTLALNDFLQETPGPAAPTLPIRKSGLNWADDVEDTYDTYDSGRSKQQAVILPTAPKAARGIDDYSDKIPQQPPFIAYLSNLPYDVDEDEIAEFFGNLNITNMRIPKDDRSGEGPKLKGFGYVEFEDRESLLCALAIPDCTLKNRRIRIEVATNSDNDRRRGGRMDMNRDRPDRPEVTMGDWRSGPRVPESSDSDRRPGGGYNRVQERERERDAPIERSNVTGGGGGGGSSSGLWRDGDRPSFGSRDSYNDRGRFDRDRDNDRRGGFAPSRRNDDDRNGGFSRARNEMPTERTEGRARPKLNLAPRTIPIEAEAQPVVKPVETVSEPRPAPPPAASIFGNAKPVDTSARERQIEERLAKEQVKTGESSLEKREPKRDDDRKKRDDEIRRSPRRSPERRHSPRRASPARSNYSPGRNQSSDTRSISPEQGRASPDKNRGPPARKIDDHDKRGPPPAKFDRLPPKDKIERVDKPKKEEKPLREQTDREMPKLKEPEAQNFITSNKFAYLEAEDNSD